MLEIAEQPPVLPMADQVEDVWEMMHPKWLRAEARIYREPRGAPEIAADLWT